MASPATLSDHLTQDELRARLHASATRIDARLDDIRETVAKPFERLEATAQRTLAFVREKPWVAASAALGAGVLTALVLHRRSDEKPSKAAKRLKKANKKLQADSFSDLAQVYREALREAAAAERQRGTTPEVALDRALHQIPLPVVTLNTEATDTKKKKSVLATLVGTASGMALQVAADAIKRNLLHQRG